MKNLSIAVFAATLAATTAFSSTLKFVVEDDLTEYNSLKWVNQYYKNPQPELLAHRVKVLSGMGYFNEPAQANQALGLFARIFAEHPDKIDGWFASFRDLPLREQRLMAGALWLSQSPKTERYLSLVAARSGSESAAALLGTQPRAIAALEVDSDTAMGIQWGAFVATGDARHITNILAAVGSDSQAIAESARFSLALKAAQDEKVMQICQNELSKQPKAVQEVLRAALNEGSKAIPSS